MTFPASLLVPWANITVFALAPLIQVYGPSRVEPPDDLVLSVLTSYPVQEISAYFFDSRGDAWAVGSTWGDDFEHAMLSMPTVNMPSGDGVMHITATDDVGNSAMADVTVLVDGPRVFDLDTWPDPGLTTELLHQPAYNLDTFAAPAMDLDLSIQAANGLTTWTEIDA